MSSLEYGWQAPTLTSLSPSHYSTENSSSSAHWTDFFLAIARRGYAEVKQRAGQVKAPRGAKIVPVQAAIEAKPGAFRISDIQHAWIAAWSGIAVCLVMLFERQRTLLTLLDAVGEPVGNADFQGLLFLYTQECEVTPSYDFVPDKCGAFSFTAVADKQKLIEAGLLAEDDQNWRLTKAGRAEARRKAVEPSRVAEFCQRHSRVRGKALIVEQYRRHPYYATRSEGLDKLRLEPEALARIKAAKPKRQPAGILTIGYEGRSLEGYLNELLRAAVTLLCDVRRNPFSHKYGFSKSTLGKACAEVGIRYEHMPALGIASDRRRELETQADYDALFAEFARESLPLQGAALETIRAWVTGGERVALTCFERLPQQCHRHCVAEALERLGGAKLKPQHL